MSVDEEGQRVWTVAEARAKLSEVMRRAESEGPQRIGVRRRYVLVPEHVWEQTLEQPQPHMGEWLVENLAGFGVELELPPRGPDRPIPFSDY